MFVILSVQVCAALLSIAVQMQNTVPLQSKSDDTSFSYVILN